MPQWSSEYANLPVEFYEKLGKNDFPNLHLLLWNKELAQKLDLDASLSDQQKAELLSGQIIPSGTVALAQAYSGHQFGQFNPHLGDGRARLIGELRSQEGSLWDIHSKGTGPTGFSRRGDGWATLAATLREYMVSEAMFALGTPTMRTLAVITTGHEIMREEAHPGAISVRVARHHVRVGTFEYFHARGQTENVQKLADFVIARQHQDLSQDKDKYQKLFTRIVDMQALLVAKWMSLGFIHGVMNTDNTPISGETIDYGPCAFMEEYDPQAVFSQIDRRGRYAFSQQPRIMQWNMACLAETFIPLLGGEASIDFLKSEVDRFLVLHTQIWRKLINQKLGFPESFILADDFLNQYFVLLHQHKLDWTLSYRYLSLKLKAGGGPLEESQPPLSTLNSKELSAYYKNIDDLITQNAEFSAWLKNWQTQLSQTQDSFAKISSNMDSMNPIYIPRNHLVEQAIETTYETKNSNSISQWQKFTQQPHLYIEGSEKYILPAKPQEKVHSTHCNT